MWNWPDRQCLAKNQWNVINNINDVSFSQRILLQSGQPCARFLLTPQDGAGRHDTRYTDRVIPPREGADGGRTASPGRDTGF